jgi:hypothetical protein
MRNSNSWASNIYWVCFDCGKEALTFPDNKSKRQSMISTVHHGRCDICKQPKDVTAARDFGYPIFK